MAVGWFHHENKRILSSAPAICTRHHPDMPFSGSDQFRRRLRTGAKLHTVQLRESFNMNIASVLRTYNRLPILPSAAMESL